VRGAPYDSSQRLDWFNRLDCLDNETITFNLLLIGDTVPLGGTHIEAWLGTACEDTANRVNGPCVKVGETSDVATATHANTSPLDGGQTYAVGVVALDNYANPSPVSEIACGIAEAPVGRNVIDLSRGGCGVSRGCTDGLGVWIVFGALGGMVRRRLKRGSHCT
jgi:hypothetical protein